MFKVVLLEDEQTHVELISKLLNRIETPIDLQVFTDSKSFVSGFPTLIPTYLFPIISSTNGPV